jgi:hypothetical protein
MGLAVLMEVFKEVVFAGELLVMLEVVEGVLKDAVVDAVFVFVGFVGLLPAEVDEKFFWVCGLLPAFSGGEDAFDKFSVVSDSDVVA